MERTRRSVTCISLPIKFNSDDVFPVGARLLKMLGEQAKEQMAFLDRRIPATTLIMPFHFRPTS